MLRTPDVFSHWPLDVEYLLVSAKTSVVDIALAQDRFPG